MLIWETSTLYALSSLSSSIIIRLRCNRETSFDLADIKGNVACGDFL